jgi:hypothetical protein
MDSDAMDVEDAPTVMGKLGTYVWAAEMIQIFVGTILIFAASVSRDI